MNSFLLVTQKGKNVDAYVRLKSNAPLYSNLVLEYDCSECPSLPLRPFP